MADNSSHETEPAQIFSRYPVLYRTIKFVEIPGCNLQYQYDVNQLPPLQIRRCRISSNLPENLLATNYKYIPIVESISTDGSSDEEDLVISGTSNFINISIDPRVFIFVYEVGVTPYVQGIFTRLNIFKQLYGETFTPYIYDGHYLYSPVNVATALNQIIYVNGICVIVSIKILKICSVPENFVIYNLLFDQICNLFLENTCCCINRMYDFEIWSNFEPSVDKYSGGTMLKVGVEHTIVRQQTVLNYIQSIIKKCNADNMHEVVKENLIGLKVSAKFDHKIYVINDVAWNINPTCFLENTDGSFISILDFYNKKYHLDIHDLHQPILINRVAACSKNLPLEEPVFLVPELCNMIGPIPIMSDDDKMMFEIDSICQASTKARLLEVKRFAASVNEDMRFRDCLARWGLTLSSNTVSLELKLLKGESILLGNEISMRIPLNYNWRSEILTRPILRPVHLTKWAVMCANSDINLTYQFISSLMEVGQRMGIFIIHPTVLVMEDHKNASYQMILEQLKGNFQLACIICPTQRNNNFKIIRRLCCTSIPIPLQIVPSSILRRSVQFKEYIESITIRITNLLGGGLWSVPFPSNNMMVCGINFYRNPIRSQGVCGFVSNIDDEMTQWNGNTCYYEHGETLIQRISSLLSMALVAYREHNYTYPDQVIMFRGGLDVDNRTNELNFDVPLFRKAMRDLGAPDKLAYVIVNEKSNSFLLQYTSSMFEGAPIGCILDNTCTLTNSSDFYLLSRNALSPATHYLVFFNNTEISLEEIKKLAFKLCHMYYPKPSTINVPACTKYAEKLATYTGKSIGTTHNPLLSRILFYLP